MNFPAELKYSKDHEWVKFEGDVAVVGISDFAQDALGDVVFVNLPQVGDEVTAGESFGDVESVKAVSDLICPVSGVVLEVNEELDDSPELLNEDCYEGETQFEAEVVGYDSEEDLLQAINTLYLLNSFLQNPKATQVSILPSLRIQHRHSMRREPSNDDRCGRTCIHLCVRSERDSSAPGFHYPWFLRNQCLIPPVLVLAFFP